MKRGKKETRERMVVIAAFFSYTTLATKFISPASRCGRDPRRCLLLSSNPPQPRGEQESSETREINTWYPIPRQKVLFDTRKNSEAGFASNFNKLDPRGADGYPHANDFQRGERLLEKGEAVEEFGIRFWSLTDGENKGEAVNRMAGMERLAKWNDTAGGGEISFAPNNTEKKSNAELGLADTYRVNNTFVKTNKLETSLVSEKAIEESEEFQNIRTMDGSRDSAPLDEFPREYLNTGNKQEKPNDSLYVSGFPGIFQKSLSIEIPNTSNIKNYSSYAKNLAEEENKDERNHTREFPQQNKEENNNNINKDIKLTSIYFKELNFPENKSFENFSVNNKTNADGGVFSLYDEMKIINFSNPETDNFPSKVTNEKNKIDTTYNLSARLEFENDGNETKYIKSEMDRNYQPKLNFSEYRPIGSFGPHRIVKINGTHYPEVRVTIRLEINDENPLQKNREAGNFSHILGESTKLFQNKPKQNKNSLDSSSLPVICDSNTCLEEKSNLNIKDTDRQFHKMLSEMQLPASFKRKRRSTDASKTFQIRYISDFYSNKVFKHNKRFARETDSRETGKLHQTGDTDLKKEDFRAFSASDNVSVATESWKSYQTGTFVPDKVTTPPSLSNEVSPKNDSVPRFDEQGRKKFELQIDEEDSLDKDLGALKMETGIGDQLRNDIKGREPNGGQYIYIRLRSLHSSLKELGKSGRYRIRAKERGRHLRMSLQEVRDVYSGKFNSSQKTFLQDRFLKYEDYVHSENDALPANHAANTYSLVNERSNLGNGISNNRRSPYEKSTFTQPKSTHLGLNQTEETSTKGKYNFELNRTEKRKNRPKRSILLQQLGRKLESKEDETTKKLNNRDEESWNFSGRTIVNKNKKFNSSQNGNYASSPFRSLNFTKVLNVNRQKRHVQSLIFDNSEQTTNGFDYRKAFPSFNTRRNSKSLLNDKNNPLLIPRFNSGSDFYIIGKSPNPMELSVFQYPYYSNNGHLPNYHTQNKYLPRSRKIRDLLRNADLLKRWRILGRSATPGKSLTFVSYPQNLTSSQQGVSRPNIRLRNWIRRSIYKDRQPTRVSRNLQISPEIHRKDPEIVLYFVLPPNERATLFPNTKVKKSQRESEDDNEDTLSGLKTDSSSTNRQFRTVIRTINNPNIGKQYARYVDDESSENVTEINDDWLNSQWLYINGFGREQGTSIDETSTRNPRFFGKTTKSPEITTTTKTTTSTKTTTTNKPKSTSTESTIEPWEDIQNMPSTQKPWDVPNEQRGRNSPWNTNYNKWNTAQMPWNSPDGRWEMERKPWNPENGPWIEVKKPWNSHQDPWKETKKTWTPPVGPWGNDKKPWNPPVDPWENDKKPWNPPVDPWEKDKKTWGTPNNEWEKENKPWKPPIDPWKPPVVPWKPPVVPWKPPVVTWKPPVVTWKPPVVTWKPPVVTWKPPIYPWEKKETPPIDSDNSWENKKPWENEKIPWNSPISPWKNEKRPWDPPIQPWKMKYTPWNSQWNNQWKKDKNPWNAPDDATKITEAPWVDPKDPWEKDKRPWKPPIDPWQAEKIPWHPPPNRWKMNKTPWNPPSNPWSMMKWQWAIPNDPWKIRLSWWDCKR